MSKNKKKKKQDSDDDDDVFDGKATNFDFKIILVGTAEVGKTSITNRYVKNTFDAEQAHSRQVEILYH